MVALLGKEGNDYGASFWGEENVLELDGGDSYTTCTKKNIEPYTLKG